MSDKQASGQVDKTMVERSDTILSWILEFTGQEGLGVKYSK